MQTLDPFKIPLENINLIEASAGTGKSWTVTFLYLRLLLEKNLTIDQILVVTFTDAATKELRDDIRQRIVSALHAFECAISEVGYEQEDEYTQLINNCEDSTAKEEAIRKLNRAKLSMDEAAVFTIHGFCQRSLSENAFEAALPFESELLENQTELMQKITDDFWRKYTQNAPKSLLFKLLQKSVTPDSLLKDVKNAVGKPYLKICGPESVEIKAEKWSDLELRFQQIINQWESDGAEVIRILLEDKNLNRRSFGAEITQRAIKEMGQLSSLYSLNSDLMELLQKFKESYVVDKTKAKCTAPEHSFFKAWETFSNLWEELNKSSDNFLNNTRIELIEYLDEDSQKKSSV